MSYGPDKEEIANKYRLVQERICEQIAEIDGQSSFDQR